MLAEQSHSSTRFPPGLFLFILLAIIAAVAVGVVDLSISHAEARHGSEAAVVRNCLQNNGPVLNWGNPFTGRRALVCQIGPELFGLQIIEGQQEITAYLKSKMTRLDQVMTYLRNTGYSPLH